MDNKEQFAKIIADLASATEAIEELTLQEESLTKKADSIGKSVENIQRLEKNVQALFDRLSGAIEKIETLFGQCDILIRRLEDARERLEALDLSKLGDDLASTSSAVTRGCELVVRKLDDKDGPKKAGLRSRKK